MKMCTVVRNSISLARGLEKTHVEKSLYYIIVCVFNFNLNNKNTNIKKTIIIIVTK